MEKKKIICLLCVGLMFTVICVLGVRSKDSNKRSTNERINTTFYNRDEKAIMKHLASYPNDFDSLEESNAFVVTTAYTHGREYWDSFIEKTRKKEKCCIDLITFSTEGDAVIMYLEYNGTDYYQFIDFRCSSYSEYESHTYSYLNILDVPEDEYEDIDFSAVKDSVKEVFLSNRKFDSYDEYTEYLNSPSYNEDNDTSFSFTIWPLIKENYLDVMLK